MDKNSQILLPNYFSLIKKKSFVKPSLIGSHIYFGYQLFSKNILESLCDDKFKSISQNSSIFFPVFYDLIENDLLKKIFFYERDKYQFILGLFDDKRNEKIFGIGEILAYDLKKLQDEINFIESNEYEILKIFQNSEIINFLEILQNENILKIFNKPEIFNDWAFKENGEPDWSGNINWIKTNYSSLFHKFFKNEDDFSENKMQDAILFIKLKCDIPYKIRIFLESVQKKYSFSDMNALKEISENRDNIFDLLISFLNNEDFKKIFLRRKEILEIVFDRQRFSYLYILANNLARFKELIQNQQFISLISDNEFNLFFRKFPEFQFYIQNQYDSFLELSRDREILEFIKFSKENNFQEVLFLNFKLLISVFEEIGINCRSQCNQIDEKSFLYFKNFLSQELKKKGFDIEKKFDQKEFDLKKEDVKNFLKDQDNFFNICKAFFTNQNEDIRNFNFFQESLLKNFDQIQYKEFANKNLLEILEILFYKTRDELNQNLLILKESIISYYQKSIFNHSPQKEGLGKILLSFFYDDREDAVNDAFRAYKFANQTKESEKEFLERMHESLKSVIEKKDDDLREFFQFLYLK